MPILFNETTKTNPPIAPNTEAIPNQVGTESVTSRATRAGLEITNDLRILNTMGSALTMRTIPTGIPDTAPLFTAARFSLFKVSVALRTQHHTFHNAI